MLLGWLVTTMAMAAPGYGDPTDGLPGPAERELHLWTNAARVDPEAFEADYNAGGCSFYEDFTEDEQTPKGPLLYSFGLTDAAEFHSLDMSENDWFDHASSDGTSFAERLTRFYDSGNVGENIAVGYPSPYEVVFTGWMCSTAGHRTNIMSGGWDELGVGVVGSYFTQDFGGVGAPSRAIAMGAHERSGDATVFLGDFSSSGGDPDAYVVVLDGVAHPMTREYGAPGRAIYRAEVQADSGCHQYYLQATVDGVETRFPETGSYGWGSCDFDDDAAGWFAGQLDATGGGDEDGGDGPERPKLNGCDATAGLGGASWLVGVGVLLARRRGNRRG